MALDETEIRELLKKKGLRNTKPRITVVHALSEVDAPLSHSELVDHLDDSAFDPATVFRNLTKLTESGLVRVVSHANGMARYALVLEGQEDHQHPHFFCEVCNEVSCLPATISFYEATASGWAESVRAATVQLRGTCPNCSTS